MKLLRKRDIPEEKYTNAFLGYGPEDSHFVIELTYSKLSDWRFTFVTPLLNSEATEFEMNLCKNTGWLKESAQMNSIVDNYAIIVSTKLIKWCFQIMELTSMISELDLAISVLLWMM